MKQGHSKLTLRKPRPEQTPVIERSPRNIAKWVKNLPLANLGESSKSTYRLLVDLNRSALTPEKRLAILLIIDPLTRDLIASLEDQFINKKIYLSDKQKKIAALVQAIQTELCLNFHNIIEMVLVQPEKHQNRKILTHSITLALKYHA